MRALAPFREGASRDETVVIGGPLPAFADKLGRLISARIVMRRAYIGSHSIFCSIEGEYCPSYLKIYVACTSVEAMRRSSK